MGADNWVEFWDDTARDWVTINVPPTTSVPNEGGPCANWSSTHGCDYSPDVGCSGVTGGPAAAMQDHEIFSYTWSAAGPDSGFDGGEILDAADMKLSNGENVSPLVWSSYLTSPIGEPVSSTGLRVVNRTARYRCRE